MSRLERLRRGEFLLFVNDGMTVVVTHWVSEQENFTGILIPEMASSWSKFAHLRFIQHNE
jgi:hypothetical protein